ACPASEYPRRTAGGSTDPEAFLGGRRAPSRRPADKAQPPQAISPTSWHHTPCTHGVSQWAPTKAIVSATGDDGSLDYPLTRAHTADNLFWRHHVSPTQRPLPSMRPSTRAPFIPVEAWRR